MQITLYTTTSENNVVNKVLTGGLTLTGSLKTATSIMTPVISISGNNLAQYNYAFIPDFNRYYFVRDITVRSNTVWEITLAVDVLMSFKDSILNVKAVLSRQQEKFNLLYNDDLVVVQANSIFAPTKPGDGSGSIVWGDRGFLMVTLGKGGDSIS